MTIQDYLRAVREQWLVMLVATTLGVVAAVAVFLVRPPEYTATLTMYVSSHGADTTQAAYQGAQLSQDRVASYTELLTSPRVTSDVIRALGLPETNDELAKKITATSKIDSVLLDVAVTDRSAQRAADIVNAVGEVFPNLVAELERPTTPNGQPAVAVRVVQPALVPAKASSLGLPTLLVLGAVAGLLIGFVGALIRNALDVSIKSSDLLGGVTHVPNLGSISFDPNVPRLPLMVLDNPHSPRSEAFRQLRTNLKFVALDSLQKVLVVTSSLPSEGKTTTLANLAIATSMTGSRVLVIEGDLRRPKLAELLGLDRAVGLTNILSGQLRADQAIQSWGRGSLDLLAAGPLPPNPSELLASRRMQILLNDLRTHYDTILIDTPPLLPVTDAAAIAPVSDGVILVCRFKKTSRTHVASAVDAIEAVSARLLGTVFTMEKASSIRKYEQYSTYYAARQPGSNMGDPSSEGRRPASRAKIHRNANPVFGRQPSPSPRASP